MLLVKTRQAKKTHSTSTTSFRKLTLLGTFVLASVLAFLFLGQTSAAGETDPLITAADPPPEEIVEPSQVPISILPNVNPILVANQRKHTLHFRRKSDFWAHKRKSHYTRAHQYLTVAPTLAYEKYRTSVWRKRAAKQHLLFVRWTCSKRQPLPVVQRIKVKGARANVTQRRNITKALNVGRRMGASRKSLVASIAAVTQEASAYNRSNGNGSSVGAFQLIDSHGTVAWRMNIKNSARWHMSRSINIAHHRPGISVGGLAQAVQGSAHPMAYNQWVPEAERTYRRYLGKCSS